MNALLFQPHRLFIDCHFPQGTAEDACSEKYVDGLLQTTGENYQWPIDAQGNMSKGSFGHPEVSCKPEFFFCGMSQLGHGLPQSRVIHPVGAVHRHVLMYRWKKKNVAFGSVHPITWLLFQAAKLANTELTQASSSTFCNLDNLVKII